MTNLCYFPTELLVETFRYLGAKDIFSLSLTCRAFLALANERLRFLERSDVGSLPALAKHGKYDSVKKLLSVPGVDIECRTGFVFEFTPGYHDQPDHPYPEKNDGATALHLAAASGHLKIVELLLDKGANPRVSGNRLVRKPQGQELVGCSYKRACQKLVAMGCTPLLAAASGGHEDIVVRFLGNPCYIDVDAKGGMNTADSGIRSFISVGCTALMCAAAGGHLKLVEYLLDDEANVNIWCGDSYDIDMMQAIHFAARGGHIEVVKLLIKNMASDSSGANSESEGFFGYAPLHFAVKMNHINLVNQLLEYGADMYLVSNEREGSALDMAKNLGRAEILRLFMDRKQTKPLTRSEKGVIFMNSLRKEVGHPPLTQEEIDNINWDSEYD